MIRICIWLYTFVYDETHPSLTTRSPLCLDQVRCKRRGLCPDWQSARAVTVPSRGSEVMLKPIRSPRVFSGERETAGKSKL